MPEDITGLLTTWGREFSSAVAEHHDDVSGQDAYEVYIKALGAEFSLARLKALGPQDIDRLAQAARTYLEAPGVQPSDIQKAVEQTLWHWGEGD